MRHSPLTFHEELEEIMEQMQDEDTSTADRLDISITDVDFNAYMEGLSNVTYH